MKNLMITIAMATALIGCNKVQEPTQEPEPIIDCDCDRVVEEATFNMPQVDGAVYYVLTTINDCSGIQRQESGNILTTDAYEVGDCYKH